MNFSVNHPILFVLVGLVVAVVLAQSVFFLIKAWKRGKELGIDKKKLRNVISSSALFTVPSALSVLATVIALASTLGLAIPWVRLSVIGNLMYETTAAESAMQAMGAEGSWGTLISDPEVYAGVAWVMTIGICFSLVVVPFLAKPLQKKFFAASQSSEKKEESADPADKSKKSLGDFMNKFATPAIFIGLIGAFVSRAILGKGKPDEFGDGAGVLSVITLIVAVVSSILLELIAKKRKLAWLEPFVMPIGMIVAMVAAVVFYNVLPESIATFEWRG